MNADDTGVVQAIVEERTPFKEFPKIARLRREMIITEKIDGTNASIWIGEDGLVRAGSRSRFITPEDDNYGFARWVKEHEDELRLGLGLGTHFGEWWGSGIQRRYGLAEKRFSLFNVHRWRQTPPPACCTVVPVLFEGLFSDLAISDTLQTLITKGSQAAPGFMKPEGVVIYHTAAKTLFKVAIEKDEEPKGVRQAEEAAGPDPLKM